MNLYKAIINRRLIVYVGATSYSDAESKLNQHINKLAKEFKRRVDAMEIPKEPPFKGVINEIVLLKGFLIN